MTCFKGGKSFLLFSCSKSAAFFDVLTGTISPKAKEEQPLKQSEHWSLFKSPANRRCSCCAAATNFADLRQVFSRHGVDVREQGLHFGAALQQTQVASFLQRPLSWSWFRNLIKHKDRPKFHQTYFVRKGGNLALAAAYCTVTLFAWKKKKMLVFTIKSIGFLHRWSVLYDTKGFRDTFITLSSFRIIKTDVCFHTSSLITSIGFQVGWFPASTSSGVCNLQH